MTNRTLDKRRRYAEGLVSWFLLAVVTGCAREPGESPTRGHLTLAAAESHAGLVGREARLFGSLYRDTQVTVLPMTTREAFVALLADSVRLAVVDRPPNAEERAAIAQLGLEVEVVRIAEDALALIVNRANRLENLTLDQAAALLGGATTDWGSLQGSGRSDPVTVVTTGRNSGAWELLAEHFFAGRPLRAPTSPAPTQHHVLERVASDPGALGVVSVPALKEPNPALRPPGANAAAAGWAAGVAPATDPAVRALAIAGTDSLGRPALRALHQANIHLGIYPLHYPVYVIFDKRSLLAAGFAAFVASAPGQKLLLDAGLVPATMPVRLVTLQ